MDCGKDSKGNKDETNKTQTRIFSYRNGGMAAINKATKSQATNHEKIVIKRYPNNPCWCLFASVKKEKRREKEKKRK